MSWEEVLKRDVDVRARELIESTKRDPLMRELERLQKEYDRIKNVHSHTKRKNNVDYKRYGASREREMSELKRRIDEIKEELLLLFNERLTKYKISKIFREHSLPVDARHNTKIHRLSLAKKWTRLLSTKKNSLGL